uniref:Transcriptional regulator n=1 Tax=Methanothermobacter marburgensis (strain ATCC BAA-927 / DSM 2133 / JCM 14651 / NBRC 100331 / OCM 82 / Marburg) TaxID=79929 RepID=UPI0001754753|nr:Chain A, Transcriptional regulator [unidentified]3BPX_B Chain B, Transcriptional regulator [unidentified]
GSHMDRDIPLKGLLSIILRSHRVFIGRELGHLNLTDAQVACLLRIHREPGIKQDELATFFHVDKGTIARTLRRLEESGFIEREQDPENRRRYILEVTRRGEEIIPLILKVEERWEDLLFRDFTEDERKLFRKMCRRLAEEAVRMRGEW